MQNEGPAQWQLQAANENGGNMVAQGHAVYITVQQDANEPNQLRINLLQMERGAMAAAQMRDNRAADCRPVE